MPLPPELRVLPGHTDETTIGAEWESNPFVRVGPGLDPRGTSRAASAASRPTLVVWSPDYDGNGKALGPLRGRPRRDRRRLPRRAELRQRVSRVPGCAASSQPWSSPCSPRALPRRRPRRLSPPSSCAPSSPMSPDGRSRDVHVAQPRMAGVPAGGRGGRAAIRPGRRPDRVRALPTPGPRARGARAALIRRPARRVLLRLRPLRRARGCSARPRTRRHAKAAGDKPGWAPGVAGARPCRRTSAPAFRAERRPPGWTERPCCRFASTGAGEPSSTSR